MLTFILILILLYIFTRFIFPYLLPRIMMFWMKRYQQSFYGKPHEAPEKKPDGALSIDYIPKTKNDKKPSGTAGDYVDFEEIKNN